MPDFCDVFMDNNYYKYHTVGDNQISFNSSPPSAAYVHQWIGSALVQIMACCLFGIKPLSKTMLDYCQLNPQEQISVKF